MKYSSQVSAIKINTGGSAWLRALVTWNRFQRQNAAEAAVRSCSHGPGVSSEVQLGAERRVFLFTLKWFALFKKKKNCSFGLAFIFLLRTLNLSPIRIGLLLSLFFKADLHHLPNEEICKVTGLVKSAILYFYVKIKINLGGIIYSAWNLMCMFKTLHDVHVPANISVNYHSLCFRCKHCHFKWGINFIKTELKACSFCHLNIVTRSQIGGFFFVTHIGSLVSSPINLRH